MNNNVILFSSLKTFSRPVSHNVITTRSEIGGNECRVPSQVRFTRILRSTGRRSGISTSDTFWHPNTSSERPERFRHFVIMKIPVVLAVPEFPSEASTRYLNLRLIVSLYLTENLKLITQKIRLITRPEIYVDFLNPKLSELNPI